VAYSVGTVARLAGVSVRTLHHYDEIGLVRPGGRTTAGYREYDEADLARLRRVLTYRELGFALDQIAEVLDAPGVDEVAELDRQHTQLRHRIARLERIAEAVRRLKEARIMGLSLDPDEILEVFGEDDPTQHADEAQARWGETDAYQESHRRTAAYGKQEWLRIKAEVADIERRLADAMAAGVAPDAAVAMDLAEEHRAHIARWFYDCDHAMHRGLGEMYAADPRFAKHYDDVAPGLAAFVSAAVAANAARHGA
jgi:DNA-binding transcriptional MerR regulator